MKTCLKGEHHFFIIIIQFFVQPIKLTDFQSRSQGLKNIVHWRQTPELQKKKKKAKNGL